MADEHAPSGLEQRLANSQAAQNAHEAASHEPKEEPKSPGTLESFVNETSSLVNNITKIGAGLAIPAAHAYAIPTLARDTAILAGTQVASDLTTSWKKDKKYKTGNFVESMALGTAMTLPLEAMIGFVNKIPTNNLLGYVEKDEAKSYKKLG